MAVLISVWHFIRYDGSQCCHLVNASTVHNASMPCRFLKRTPGLTMERQRQDIKDFNPAGLSCLRDCSCWIAFGKHLCGAASDFTLRCCVQSLQSLKALSTETKVNQQETAPKRSPDEAGSHQDQARGLLLQNGAGDATEVNSRGQEDSKRHTSLCGQSAQEHEGCQADHQSSPCSQETFAAGNSNGGFSIPGNNQGKVCSQPTLKHTDTDPVPKAVGGQVSNGWQGSSQQTTAQFSYAHNAGVAVATCCHHRCSWNHYVNPAFFLKLGFTPVEFELISWMAGTVTFFDPPSLPVRDDMILA